MKRPNLIYILTDDQRADMLGIAGHPVLQTPHIDQLAQDGVWFRQARCTSALCTPSRVSHYTGQWERRHGVNFNSPEGLSPEAWDQGFIGQLKQHGYWTAWVGKNHVPVGATRYTSGTLESRFDVWMGNHGHSSFYPKELQGDAGVHYHEAPEDTQPEIFSDRAMAALDARDPDRPFCMCVTFNAPHESATGTMQMRPGDDVLYREAYREHLQEFLLPETYRSWKSSYHKLPLMVYNGVQLPGYDYVKVPHFLRETMLRQTQLLTGIDRFVGKLRSKLHASGLAEDTIIIFSSDHGVLFGEHGLGGKALPYEPALRIPLILFDPREQGGLVSDDLVAVPDLAPTVLELCGLPPAPEMQGVSLVPIVQGQEIKVRDTLFVENLFDEQNYPRCEGILDKDWKYLRYYSRSEDANQEGSNLKGTTDEYHTCRQEQGTPVYEELFHLAEDPHETMNVCGSLNAPLEHYRLCCDQEVEKLLG